MDEQVVEKGSWHGVEKEGTASRQLGIPSDFATRKGVPVERIQ